MNLIADESVDRSIVKRLRAHGHDVVYVAEIDPGIPDESVLALAKQKGALLLTADRDFGELIYRQGSTSAGVMLIRLAGLSPLTKADLVSSALKDRASELADAFSVLSPGAIRIRSRSD